MIHYMSTQGVGDAWVGNELRVVARAGIPFRLHALTRPAATYFSSADIAEMERGTRYLYPVSAGGWRATCWPRPAASAVGSSPRSATR